MAYFASKNRTSNVYSYTDLERTKRPYGGRRYESWRHYSRLSRSEKGDMALIYHTGDEKQVVEIAEIISNPYIDPGLGIRNIFVFDIKPKEQIKESRNS